MKRDVRTFKITSNPQTIHAVDSMEFKHIRVLKFSYDNSASATHGMCFVMANGFNQKKLTIGGLEGKQRTYLASFLVAPNSYSSYSHTEHDGLYDYSSKEWSHNNHEFNFQFYLDDVFWAGISPSIPLYLEIEFSE